MTETLSILVTTMPAALLMDRRLYSAAWERWHVWVTSICLLIGPLPPSKPSSPGQCS